MEVTGVVDCKAGRGSVELKKYPLDHPFAQLSGSDNIISFTTQRYAHQPLIVRCVVPFPDMKLSSYLCVRRCNSSGIL